MILNENENENLPSQIAEPFRLLPVVDVSLYVPSFQSANI